MLAIWIVLTLAVTGTAGWFAYHPERIPRPAGPGIPARTARALVWFAAWLRDGITRILDRLRGEDEPPPLHAAPPPPSAPAAPAAPLPVVAEPATPSMDSAVIPLEWAALASRVAAFEPESDAEFIQFIQGEMAGMLAHAEGWQAQSETLLTVIGLDPNATEAVTALGEVLADVAHDYAMVVRRFMAVYGQIQEAVADGVILPYNARTWLTGEGAA